MRVGQRVPCAKGSDSRVLASLYVPSFSLVYPEGFEKTVADWHRDLIAEATSNEPSHCCVMQHLPVLLCATTSTKVIRFMWGRHLPPQFGVHRGKSDIMR